MDCGVERCDDADDGFLRRPEEWWWPRCCEMTRVSMAEVREVEMSVKGGEFLI